MLAICLSALAICLPIGSVYYARLGLIASVYSLMLRKGRSETIAWLVREKIMSLRRANKYANLAVKKYGDEYIAA